MSNLVKYNTITTYLSGIIGTTTGYTNITVFIGDPVTSNVRPSARISLAEEITTEYQGFTQYFSTAKINIGIEVLYEEEQTFLAHLDPLINEINTNATTVCGVEFTNVIAIKFSSEDAKYSRATITVESQYYHD